jgi:septum site-determining protein MinD
MSRIVVVHSFRGGTGKSNITANTAGLLAQRGRRVGIIDTDLQSPGIHVLFGFSGEHRPEHTLNDFLAGTATLDQVATDVSDRIPGDGGGAVQLVASSISPADIATVLRDGYDVERLNDALVQLGGYLELDYLFVDTHPGLNEETLLTVAICDTLLVLLRPDQQDYQGTAVTVDVATKLGVPEILLAVNKIYEAADPARVTASVEGAYGVPAIAALPLSQDVAANASADLFTLTDPDHPWSQQVRAIADRLDAGAGAGVVAERANP